MKNQNFIEIKTYNSGELLYRAAGLNVGEVLTQAVAEGVCLDYADLRYANLVNVNLDDAVMRHACFAGANLMGANMSEGLFDHSDFSGASLSNVCLCYSSLIDCSFEGASFGATDVAGTILEECRFSGLSAFTLNFRDVEKLARCVFVDIFGGRSSFFRAPVVVQGLTYPVILLDDHIKVGNLLIAFDEWKSYLNAPRACERFDQAHIYAFLRQHQVLLATLIAQRAAVPARRLLTAV